LRIGLPAAAPIVPLFQGMLAGNRRFGTRATWLHQLAQAQWRDVFCLHQRPAPAGVGPVLPGDRIAAAIDGLGNLSFTIGE
jgi:hypothetical protein